jgi:hypothetical protein
LSSRFSTFFSKTFGTKHSFAIKLYDLTIAWGIYNFGRHEYSVSYTTTF